MQSMRTIVVLLAFYLSCATWAQAQSNVNGLVTDLSGEPLIGVSVLVKGTANGTVTDLDGKFMLVANNGDIFLVSYVGYISQEIKNDNKYLRIMMEEDTKKLEEVVVVGYGTQKKVNLTGAVSSLGADNIENKPVTQASQALAGLSSGVTVSMSSGRPGNDAASIKIRGLGTFSSAGSDPLVLIDGLDASINDVDPNNIKSISILKDAASAAIYGTRAANGVILIETKRGKKGKTQVSYDGYVGWQKVTETPDFVNSWEYATLRNEADKNEDKAMTYQPEEIEKFRNGSDPDNYPNVPHLKNLVNSGSGFQTSHSISIMGGGDKSSYLLSVGYLHQDGIVAKNDYDKYNFQFNVDSDITKRLKLKASISGYTSDTQEPRHGEGDMMSMIGYTVREGAHFAGKKSDGTYGYQDNYCPEGWLDSPSFTKRKSNQFMGGAELEWNLFKDFFLSGKAGYKYYNYYDKDYTSELKFDEHKTYQPNSLTVYNGNVTLITLQALARYSKIIKTHKLDFLVGSSQETYVKNWGTGYRKSFPNDLLHELNAGSSTGMNASGSAEEYGLRSFFGRVNYSLLDRYLLEFNARYDGTSRFPTDGRWGFFPSVSGAWRISEEGFIKNNLRWIDNLKVRLSWGRLGNQNIGNYPYQNVISLGQNYPFGNNISSGGRVTTLANSNITWETTEVTDFGVDLTVLGGTLDLVFDYYDKRTSDILYKISASSVLGMTPSEMNAASVRNTGYEITINYRTHIGNVKLGISPNFSYTKNRVQSLANGLQNDVSQGLFVGQPLDAIYGYEADGLFVDDTDIANYPAQPYSAEPGFIRFKDISGPNGVPDGQVDATYDRKVLGSTFPKFSYGLNLSAEYKGVDCSILLHGLGGFKQRMGSYQAYAFYNGGQIQKWQAENRWTEENPDRNAEYIKLTTLGMTSGVLETSSYWLRNGSFLRVKNIQVGYTFPQSLVKKMNLSQLRVYFSGQNLFCINNYYKGWDPEMAQNTGDHSPFYPITAVYTLGLNVKF